MEEYFGGSDWSEYESAEIDLAELFGFDGWEDADEMESWGWI